MKGRTIYTVILILCLSGIIQGQEKGNSHYHFVAFKPQFFQIKDQFNYGLVFYGLNLTFEYTYLSETPKRIFSYSPMFTYGTSYNKGIGANIAFRPIDLFYGWKINKSEEKIFKLGPYFSTNYYWQIYPELQSGHMLWFSSIEFGPGIDWKFPFKERQISIFLSNSIAGWTSRSEPSTETYYYSMTFSDFFTNAHSNLKFGSFNLFNHTNLKVYVKNKCHKRLSMGYEFEYFGYFKDPRLNYIVHSFNLIWKVGKIQ